MHDVRDQVAARIKRHEQVDVHPGSADPLPPSMIASRPPDANALHSSSVELVSLSERVALHAGTFHAGRDVSGVPALRVILPLVGAPS